MLRYASLRSAANTQTLFPTIKQSPIHTTSVLTNKTTLRKVILNKSIKMLNVATSDNIIKTKKRLTTSIRTLQEPTSNNTNQRTRTAKREHSYEVNDKPNQQ
jgi:hypothetical protein